MATCDIVGACYGVCACVCSRCGDVDVGVVVCRRLGVLGEIARALELVVLQIHAEIQEVRQKEKRYRDT